ncbi:hypothetical protein VTO73DRAFT_12162 [Trametes versicolor]
MSGNAAALKQRGNERFKAGDFLRASELYAQAEKADPRDAVYPSNLSAALYEAADYAACSEAVLRSWKLLRGREDAKADLTARLSGRLAKSLCHGVRAKTVTLDSLAAHGPDIQQIRDVAVKTTASSSVIEELNRVWSEWDAVKAEATAYVENGREGLRGFSRLPMFYKPLDTTREFFSIGTDDIIDLTAGWGPEQLYPLKFDKLQSLDVAFLFGGVGDGRHAFGTIAGLSQALTKLPKAKRSQFNAHLTLLDIHDGTIARDLCILLLLHELNSTSDSTARSEIKATLTYTFGGVAMPDYCYRRLEMVIKDLRKRLDSTPPDLPAWLYLSSDSVPAITPTLDYWLTTKKTTKRMLERHSHMSPDDPRADILAFHPGGNKDRQKAFKDKRDAAYAQIRTVLQSLTPEQLRTWPIFSRNTPAAEMLAYVRNNMETLVEKFWNESRGGKVPLHEEAWYWTTKVFFPPRELLKRHPGFDEAWKRIRNNEEISESTQRKLQKQIESEWKPNITLFDTKCADPKCYPDADGYPDYTIDMFHTVAYMDHFNKRNGPHAQDPMRTDENMLAALACGAFFEEVAAAIKSLDGHIVVELICGGLSDELLKMQCRGDVTRPAEFPRKYTRMWLSNVPDYTHGTQNVIVYAIPSLQDDSQAALAFNCMLNTMAWGGDDEFFTTYTLLLPTEVSRYLGCRVIDSKVVMKVCVLGSQSLPRPLSSLATREELTAWLTRILFNTFIPARSKPRPHNVHAPHNLTAFFALLFYLHHVGYPAHWLPEFLARVLSGSMVSDIPRYDGSWPIPVTERLRRVPSRRVRTDPWLVDFENIIATAYNALPFPIATALPEDFSRDITDIQVWEAQVMPAQRFSMDPWMNTTGSPYDPRTSLLFWKPSEVAASALIGDMARIFEGKGEPAPGTFFVLTMQEYVQYETRIRFKLSRRRVARMRTEKWSMMAYRHDNGQQATRPVPVEKWTLVT